MKSIRKYIVRNYWVLIACAFFFIACNILVYTIAIQQDKIILQDYQEINKLMLINNQRKTSFKLYCKSNEQTLLENYEDDCKALDKQLDYLADKMRYDNKSKMLYRQLCQVVEHFQKTAEQYTKPVDLYNLGILNYLDEVELELDQLINQLINHYLEYLNQRFEQKNNRLKISLLVMNFSFIFGWCVLLKKNYAINDKILESIAKLSTAATEIINKNFEAEDIEKINFLEINQVAETFDQMKHTIRIMIQELKEQHQMKEHLAEAKIRELQMQMNPHFLFNTLSLVVRNIQLGEKETSVQLIQCISRMLRSSIEIKSLAISLDDEIDLLQAYLYIQKLHLRGRVIFNLDVRKSFLEVDFKIPPLTIQPLVENCVQHGLKDKTKDGKVEILITEKADYMEVIVTDNGCGFEKSENKMIKDIKRDENISKTSIGINNVKQRLMLFYGRSDVMEAERINDITKITLKLYKQTNY